MKATPYWVLLLLACFFSQIRFAICRTMTVLDYGAVPGETIEPSVLLSNCRAFQEAFDSAVPGDVLVVPASHTFSLVGGIRAQNLINFTFALEGRLNCVHNLSLWPRSSEVQWMNGACKENCDEAYEDLIAFSNNTALTIRGSVGGESTVDGNGKHWWNDVLIGLVGTDRPVLISVSYCTGVVVENLHLLNGPHFHLWLSQLVDVEVRNVNVTVDRRVQQEIKRQLAQKFQREEINHTLSSATLQPWDLNTDGIDVSGVNVHIHDCYVRNDDDSIAVKPAKDSPNFWTQASVVGALNSTANGPRPTECSENIIIENVELTGFGASVGSVGAKDSPQRACIRNVSWRNVSMPNTGKGIYVKTNKGCTTKDGTPKTGSITNVRYENVHISNAKWIPIWIGPQQQHEPHTDLGQEW